MRRCRNRWLRGEEPRRVPPNTTSERIPKQILCFVWRHSFPLSRAFPVSPLSSGDHLCELGHACAPTAESVGNFTLKRCMATI
ncbi:hypothetical protein LINGRAHAP2_LOCUS35345 [Linum grandiflorum]